MTRLRPPFSTRFLIAWLILSLYACDTSPPIDPRKELNDIGIQYSEEEYLRCIVENDIRAVNLFLLAGMPMEFDVPKSPTNAKEWARHRALHRIDGHVMALAAKNNNREMVELFIGKGARVEPVLFVLRHGDGGKRPDNDALRIVIDSIEDWRDLPSEDAFYHLLLAMELGSNDAVLSLLDQGAPIRPSDTAEFDNGFPHLLRGAVENGNEEIIRTLIENGVRVNTEESSPTWGESSLLTWAIDNETDIELIDILITHGVNIGHTGKVSLPIGYTHRSNEYIEITPLGLASRLQETQVLVRILDEGPEQSDLDRSLHWAIDARSTNAIQTLISAGANANSSISLWGEEGVTPAGRLTELVSISDHRSTDRDSLSLIAVTLASNNANIEDLTPLQRARWERLTAD